MVMKADNLSPTMLKAHAEVENHVANPLHLLKSVTAVLFRKLSKP